MSSIIGRRFFIIVGLTLALATRAEAQASPPWTVVILPNANPLRVAECSPVRIELIDPVSKAAPRGPRGAYISIADFDLAATGGREGIAVGRYDGAGSWSACACPGTAGSSVTITATYPARSIAPAARVPEVAFQSSITVPVVAGRSSAVPIGCETAKTTTVSTGGARPAAGPPTAGDPWPWTVTIIPTVPDIPVGSCIPVSIDLRDATGKKEPRNAAGARIAFSDFDMSVMPAQSGAAAGLPGVCSAPASSTTVPAPGGGTPATTIAVQPGGATVAGPGRTLAAECQLVLIKGGNTPSQTSADAVASAAQPVLLTDDNWAVVASGSTIKWTQSVTFPNTTP